MSGFAAQPNVIFIMNDDMGFSDLECYGNEIEAPSLDALASKGLHFTQFCNTSRFCPTLSSLMTGLPRPLDESLRKHRRRTRPGELLGIFFWREGRGDRRLAEHISEKGVVMTFGEVWA